MKRHSPTIHVGISGWRYAPWRGNFYPDGLRQVDELRYASRALGSIEINGTFYALQQPERFAAWAAVTPDEFIFSVKGPRFITHFRRLRNITEALANFYASGPLSLKRKLGPTLWQFPPNMHFDAGLFENFFAQLPHTGEQAHAIAGQHTEHLQHPGRLEINPRQRLRHAVEIRHDSFMVPAFIALLRKYRIALVVADSAKKWPYIEDLTCDFVYIRLHGSETLYSSGYSQAALQHWCKRILVWQQGSQPDDAKLIGSKRHLPNGRPRDVYCYFDNDLKVRAPYDARRLIELLGLDKGLIVQPGKLPSNDSLIN